MADNSNDSSNHIRKPNFVKSDLNADNKNIKSQGANEKNETPQPASTPRKNDNDLEASTGLGSKHADGSLENRNLKRPGDQENVGNIPVAPAKETLIKEFFSDDKTSKGKITGKDEPEKKRRLLSGLLLIFALVCFTIGAVLLIRPVIIHKQQDSASQNLLKDIKSNRNAVISFHANQMKVDGEVIEQLDPKKTVTDVPVNDNQIVEVSAGAVMKIPCIDLEMPVADDASVYSLRVAIGHYPYTPVPGEDGSAVYFGHRMYNYGRHFNRLDEVAIGEKVIIEQNGYRYTYTVDKNYKVKPADLLDVIYPKSTDRRCVLITCDPKNAPPGGAPYRLIVEGALTSTEKIGG